MSDQMLHPERETGLADDVESQPLRGKLTIEGEATMEREQEEDDQ